MSELKDYDIMDIEAMDDERLKNSESGRIQTTRVYKRKTKGKQMANQQTKSKTIDINGQTYYTKFGAAERLKMSEASLKREANSRRISSMKHTTGLVFLQEWLDEWIEKRRTYARKFSK